MIRVSASQLVAGAHFPNQVIPTDFKKMSFTASMLGAQQKRNSVENKPASLLVVSLGTAQNKQSLSSCGR